MLICPLVSGPVLLSPGTTQEEKAFYSLYILGEHTTWS